MIKNDIRYIIKRVIIGILIILIMSFINNKIPKALEVKSVSLNTNTDISGYGYNGYGNILTNVNFAGNWTETYTFNSNNNVTGYDFIQFGFLLQYNFNGQYTETTQINEIYMVCSSWSNEVITYADGTQATISQCGVWQKVKYLGNNQFTPVTNETTTGNETNIPYISINIDAIYNNNQVTPCEINSVNYGNTYVSCKIPNSSTSINSIRFRNTGGSNYLSTLNGRIGIQNYYILWKDPMSIVSSNQQDTTNAINNVNNSINNSSVDNSNANSTIQNINNLIPTNNSVSSLISLPITLISSINNGISGSCTGIHLFTIYDYSFTLPCINLAEYLGVTWVIIDTIMSGMLVYAIAKTFIRVFSSLTEMDSNIIKEAYKE